VLRLFKRVKSLKKILDALVKSIPGVLNAFAVLLIFMCIFAIVAVDAFRDFGQPGTYETVQVYGAADALWGQGEGMTFDGGTYSPVENSSHVSAITARGFHYGQEYYGTFSRSLYTLFQVLTGESWSEAVVRPLIFGDANKFAPWVAMFFTVYILLTQVVLQNVVVAVLLDNFSTDNEKEEEKKEEEESPPAAAAEAQPSDAAAPAMSPTGPVLADVEADLPQQLQLIMKEQEMIKAQLKEIIGRLGSMSGSGALTAMEA